MVEKNLYVNYFVGQDFKSVLIKNKSEFDNLVIDIIPHNVVYQVHSDYPVDFQNSLLDYISERFPEVDIECQHYITGEETPHGTFDWRIKKSFVDVTKSLKVMSKCTRLKVCCIIVKNNRIISTGVNGTPKGFRNCSDVFSPKDRLLKGYSTKHHEFSEAYEVHAEMNAVLELGRNTSIDSYDDLELFCSTCPCPGCAKMIAQSGIKRVYYAEDYDRMPEGAKNLQEFGIEVYKI